VTFGIGVFTSHLIHRLVRRNVHECKVSIDTQISDWNYHRQHSIYLPFYHFTYLDYYVHVMMNTLRLSWQVVTLAWTGVGFES